MMLKELKDFVKRFKLKPMKFRANISTTSTIRAKCRFCMSGPENYFVQGMPVKWYNPKRIQEMTAAITKLAQRMCQDYYLIEEPKSFTGIVAFSCYPLGRSYNPALHRKRNIIAVEEPVEFLSCGCGKTAWGFAERSASIRPEVHQRKGRYKYPHNYDDWF